MSYSKVNILIILRNTSEVIKAVHPHSYPINMHAQVIQNTNCTYVP